MNRHFPAYKSAAEPFNYQVSKSTNPMGIIEINFIWDHHSDRLIAIMKSDHMFNNEIISLLKGNRLILEAPLISFYNKPYRTHLIEQKTRSAFDMQSLDIVFSEVELKAGYEYTFISSELIDPCLFKVILGYKSLVRHQKN